MNHWDKKPPMAHARGDTTGQVMGPDQLRVISPVAEKPRRTGQQQVRQPQQEGLAEVDSEPSSSPLAHPSNRLLIQLNPQWRVIDDDLQYILQNRKGNSRSKATGWRSRSFCRTREALFRCVREYCGPVTENALRQVRALPEWHLDR